MPIKQVEVRVRSSTNRVEVGVGLPGIQGPPGADGTPGGPPGPDGDSAYQVAVDNGFVGTESEWLASLVGPAGADGTDGTDGVSVVGATVDGSYHLILDMSAGPDIDAGYVRGPTGAAGADGADGIMASIVAGTGISVDATDPANPIVSATASGSGDVVGPASSVAGRFAAFADTTGKLLSDSGVSAASFATAAQGTLADNAIAGAGVVTSGNPVVFSGTTGKAVAQVTYSTFKTSLALVKGDVGLGNVDNTSDANKPISTAQQAALDLKADLASPPLTGIPTAPTAAASTNTTQIATTAMVQAALAAYIAAQDVLVFKGVIDASTNPNYPAADAGHVYKISVAGKIGGASGPNVEVGDVLTCLVDGSAAGTQAAVGANWVISQVNIDGAVTGPTSSTDASVAGFNGTTGKIIKALSATEIRAAAGLATSDSPQFTAINLGHASDTTIARSGAGVVTIEGVEVVTVSATQTLSGKTLDTPVLRNAITVEGYAFNTSTNAAVDLANGTLQVPTLTGNWVPNTGWPTATLGQGFRMILKTGAGSFTVTWPSSVKWAAGTAPTITATASRADIIDFESDGSVWYGYVVGQAYVP